MPSEKPLVHFVVDQEFMKCVDDYRFRHRFKSRAAAIRFLMKAGLSQDPKPEEHDLGDDQG